MKKKDSFFQQNAINEAFYAQFDWLQLRRRDITCNVFEPRTAIGSEHFARYNSGLSQIFKIIVFASEKILNSTNVVVWRQVKYENSALPVGVRGSKTLHA